MDSGYGRRILYYYCIEVEHDIMNNFSVLQNRFQAFFKIVYNGNAVPMHSCNILTMGTAFPCVPPRNDHCRPALFCCAHNLTRQLHKTPNVDNRMISGVTLVPPGDLNVKKSSAISEDVASSAIAYLNL
jgi:hypothetical protein